MAYSWTIIDTGKNSPEKNMSIDEELLLSLKEDSKPILHLYDWNAPSLTYGHFIDPSHFLHLNEAEAIGLKLAKRPTGGGIIFHLTDFAFSILIPSNHPSFSLNTLENYAFINLMVIDVIKRFCGNSNTLTLLPKASCENLPVDNTLSKHFCMAKPTCLDVMLDGKKVSGGAQRRKRFGFLHQGTISLTLPSDEFLSRILKENPNFNSSIQRLMKENTMQLLPLNANEQEISKAKTLLANLFKTTLATSQW